MNHAQISGGNLERKKERVEIQNRELTD